MTDPAIIAASYAAERNYSHDLDDVIDASDAVGAWGTAKESTTDLTDLSGNGNTATIHGAMPAEGFIQGRRYGGVRDYLDCGNDPSVQLSTSGSYSFISICEPSNGGDFCIFNADYKPRISMDTVNKQIKWYDGIDVITPEIIGIDSGKHIIQCNVNELNLDIYVDGILKKSGTTSNVTMSNLKFGHQFGTSVWLDGIIYYAKLANLNIDAINFFNTLARLPFWAVNYTDYPDNVTTYTDNLPYSSSIISSGTFKVDDDVLNCVNAGTITYRASYEFDGSEYIKVEIGGVEYAGTGTITQGNTTVSVAQGSNKITIIMGTADTIDKVRIQFREEV